MSALEFESRFESGNLYQAWRVSPQQYILLIRNDLSTLGHTQWFYFRVRNMIRNKWYNFKIINFSKKHNLYSQGMQPLVYSEHLAEKYKIGWFRSGSNVRYRQTNVDFVQRFSYLRSGKSYYTLEWDVTFPQDNDTCFMAHCYPYNYTNLQQDLSELVSTRPMLVQLNSLCSTLAGNTCFHIAVDDSFAVNRDKKVAVITARVHPGESNSSLIVKGLLDYLTSYSSSAQELRKLFAFHIIPMLNPDGVIVGNYRCSLAGKDLNRTFNQQDCHLYPTIYHFKKMLEKMKDKIVLYCDLHGHSQKHDVFMYGCSRENLLSFNPELYLQSRLIPWLMAKQSPEKFLFSGCTFHIKKNKESTGRAVVFKQFNVENSYTLEATFSGSPSSK
ncbi:hypothetical protein HELRODRAFT_67454 [Helobdella robusta]|uniref:Peptidase M14 domain-containing protein n=1 Tax=Helobdella robusta TaxID=6412 RepID=T1FZ11_HELRO|nr:hypothetical protein HELRODRAFT_67454 [Helobdella robusta]ESN99193.1 hypothetical protein HELRODRAFT_67454 [Helobdella robusta]